MPNYPRLITGHRSLDDPLKALLSSSALLSTQNLPHGGLGFTLPKGAITVTGFSPTVSRTQNITVLPGTGQITVGGQVPTIQNTSARSGMVRLQSPRWRLCRSRERSGWVRVRTVPSGRRTRRGPA